LLGRTLLFGDPGDVRLTVKFNSTNSRKLQHWHTWILQHEAISNIGPSGERDFYVHLGVIPAAQIELPPITARIALLGMKADAPQRKQLESLPPDTLLNLDVAASRALSSTGERSLHTERSVVQSLQHPPPSTK
jgi:hypothetical protein